MLLSCWCYWLLLLLTELALLLRLLLWRCLCIFLPRPLSLRRLLLLLLHTTVMAAVARVCLGWGAKNLVLPLLLLLHRAVELMLLLRAVLLTMLEPLVIAAGGGTGGELNRCSSLAVRSWLHIPPAATHRLPLVAYWLLRMVLLSVMDTLLPIQLPANRLLPA